MPRGRLLFWCALIIIFDGYDLVIYGVVLPTLMKELAKAVLRSFTEAACGHRVHIIWR